MIMNSREDKIMEKSKLTKTDFWKVFFVHVHLILHGIMNANKI